MKKYKEVTLGSEAVVYIKDILKYGNTISKYLLQSYDFEKGKVVTYLPYDINNEDARHFKVGGKIKSPAEYENSFPIPIAYLMNSIKLFLKGGESRLCIFEDVTSKPKDPRISSKDDRIYIYGDEIYYALFGEDAENNEKIHDTIWDSDSHWHFVCIMTSLSKKSFYLRNNKNLNANELKMLVEGTERVAIGAYDGEGYLIWTRC
ncbi:hypothetical protein Psfp_01960 [Pelotomaculum sp. FP]|uniref:hypothetical protein n=1 Tax=Pelotomaculum sp. FP TaxID=261474 RepID=UPI0010649409|nr:hypothetical protein [Pelotomaculum sp. FP]TEB15729.1 hypothetical protein Psfp_01960 [Pelotomaculum sp. FP]